TTETRRHGENQNAFLDLRCKQGTLLGSAVVLDEASIAAILICFLVFLFSCFLAFLRVSVLRGEIGRDERRPSPRLNLARPAPTHPCSHACTRSCGSCGRRLSHAHAA